MRVKVVPIGCNWPNICLDKGQSIDHPRALGCAVSGGRGASGASSLFVWEHLSSVFLVVCRSPGGVGRVALESGIHERGIGQWQGRRSALGRHDSRDIEVLMGGGASSAIGSIQVLKLHANNER